MRAWGVGLLLASVVSMPVFAADMPVKATMPAKAPMMAAPYNWTGFYIGVNAGGGWAKQDNSLETTAGALIQQNSTKLDGAVGGGQIGYNWQVNQIVFGVEAD